MKRIVITIAVLCMFGVLAAPVMAGGGMHTNIVQVSHPYYGGHHGGYHGGWNGYRVYYPPVRVYRQVVTRYPGYPVEIPPPVYSQYNYYPSSGFYYSSPGLSIGVGF